GPASPRRPGGPSARPSRYRRYRLPGQRPGSAPGRRTWARRASRLAPYLDAALAQVGLRLGDRVRPEVEDRRRQHRVGATLDEPLVEMLEGAGAARSDHRHRHGQRDRARELEIVTVLGSVAIHAGQEDLAGAAGHRLARPFDRVAPGRPAPAVGVDTPPRRLAWSALLLPGVDRDDDALAAEALDRLADHLRPIQG